MESKKQIRITRCENGYICISGNGKTFVYTSAKEVLDTMAKDFDYLQIGKTLTIEYEYETNGKQD